METTRGRIGETTGFRGATSGKQWHFRTPRSLLESIQGRLSRKRVLLFARPRRSSTSAARATATAPTAVHGGSAAGTGAAEARRDGEFLWRCNLEHRRLRRVGHFAPNRKYAEYRQARSEEHTSELQSRRDIVCR